MLFKKRLMTPGPTEVPPSVLAEAAKPIMHHRTPQFRQILTDTVAAAKRIFRTQSDLLIFPAAGTGGMEAAMVNLCSPGDMGPDDSAHMVRFLSSLKGKLTIVLIEHDMEAVFALADRISVLVYGRVIATGSPEEIHRNKDVREAYLGDEEAASC